MPEVQPAREHVLIVMMALSKLKFLPPNAMVEKQPSRLLKMPNLI